ncbi:protein ACCUMULATION AND REPLICATION OF CHLOROPLASTS 3 [Cinnamomum micranthum f. kanehirae]|uniref:Protein ACCUMULATION AND REPLICATION OF CHLOROPLASTS 3 n=1 Tax=Cinnamomum micranthum f. kanehirae TaxID=337451 RepID=A0A443NJ30_9MAGN|nr:protein ACCUMULATION AND REPLICATION OF CHLOROPLASTS 3 [Cinnamomum micranthum f. kanehirae]
MELLLETTLLHPPQPKLSLHRNLSRSKNLLFSRQSPPISTPLRLSSKPNGHVDRDSNAVEVIGIGSRKDAVLDFCLEASFESTSTRFWTIHMRDSQEVQLIQRSLGADVVLKNMEGQLLVQSCPRAVVLVASAGYGSDHTTGVELLDAVKSAEGLAVAIVLRPFGFEGQRRQHEVRDLVNMLREHRLFCIVVDTDALLKKEVLTLAEALRSAHIAVLLAINSISVLMSDMHPKLIDSLPDGCKEVKVSEILRQLGSYREAEVGFGAGHNIKSSIANAIFDCPFLTGGLKDLNGIVICTLASATMMDNSDIHSFTHAFRQTTEYTKEIIFSRIHEPVLQPNLIVTTLLVLGCKGQKVSPKKSFLSSLALHFPFVFNFLRRGSPESEDHVAAQSPGDPCLSEALSPSNSGDMPVLNPSDSSNENVDVQFEELETVLGNGYEGVSASRKSVSKAEASEVGFSLTSTDSISPHYDQTSGGQPAFQREPLSSWSDGPGFHIAQQWAKERAIAAGSTSISDEVNLYALPIGVKPSEQSTYGPQLSNPPQPADLKNLDDMTGETLHSPNVTSWDVLTDVGFEAVMEICNAASTFLKGKYVNGVSRKQGLLSARAASMLEAERDSQKKWTPITEMKYRGGIYKGRCQGGLPEGKGRLTLADGSFYDGTWRFGKRSGLGTFCYSNGDVFQGSWRDDLMHGKGWFYFHTGDRWFANFWKGKANGEGRYYSKYGNIFFGQFKDGWRHGQCLSIDIDGTRWNEIWDEGVLVSRNKLDDDETGEP